jgi:uncharacterized protein (TIGR00269 family)
MRISDKEFIQNFENKVKSTVEKFSLVSRGDKILVACSGGKDSTTTLYLLNKFGYHAEAMFIDLHLGNFSRINLKNIKSFCEENSFKLHVFSFREEFGCSVCYMRSILKSNDIVLRSCHICGILRRWLLNKKARELGFTKLATGHNLDDEAETILMNFFSGNINLILRLGPKAGIIEDNKFVPRIKPLYFCTNEETTRYSKLMQFPVLYEKCPCSVNAYRGNFRRFIKDVEEKYPKTRERIVGSFLKMLPELRKSNRTNEKINYCEICGEPSSKSICNVCDLFRKLTR